MLYNPFLFEMHKDPYATYEYLLEHEPVQHNQTLGFWSVSRFEDVWSASKDAQTFSSSCGPILEMEMPMPIMLAMDAPDHNRLRSLVSNVFTPNAINTMEAAIRHNVCGYLDSLHKLKKFDLINDFSAKFPMDTISTMLGIPESDRAQLQEWTRIGMQRTPGNPEVPLAGQIAMGKSVDYFVQAMNDRRRTSQNDMISTLVHARMKTDSDDTRPLNDAELLGFLMMLIAAGYETVMRFFGLTIYNLYKNPTARQELIQNPTLIPKAIEEFLRYDNPGQYLARLTTRDVVIQDVTIPKGEKVILLHGAAMRDHREYENPNSINFHRKITRQIGFGNGAHLCLGAALARLETRIALEELLKRFPDYSINEAEVVHSHCANVRGFDCLPIER
jgi:cytochrome P450